MRISPIANTQIVTRPSFGQKANLKFSKESAQLLLDNYASIGREHFQDGLIYTGIAKLSFNDWDGKQNIENFKKLFAHTLIDLGMKVEELRSDIAFEEALEQHNNDLVKLMFYDMHMLPVKPDGKVDAITACAAHNIVKDQKFSVGNAWYSTYDNRNIFGTYVPPVRDNSAKISLLNQAKELINKDEEAEGLVTLDTIYKIVSNPEFNKIKDESLNISGSRILHILSEACFETNDDKDVSLVYNIIQKCVDAEYDFDIKNNFGETAEDKAIEAEKEFLAKVINKRGCKPEEDKDTENSNSFFNKLFHKRRT